MDSSTKILLPPLPQLPVLHYLLTESKGEYSAHCLDLDMIAVGKNREEAGRKLDDLVQAQIELTLATRQLVNLTTRAPQSYWMQFINGRPIDLEPQALRIKNSEKDQFVASDPSEYQVGMVAKLAAA